MINELVTHNTKAPYAILTPAPNCRGSVDSPPPCPAFPSPWGHQSRIYETADNLETTHNVAIIFS